MWLNRVVFFAFFNLLCLYHCINAQDDVYQIGFGIGDITGPAGEINMVTKLIIKLYNDYLFIIKFKMGYAKPGQETAGIHFRLYSRATIIQDNKGSRICYVSADVAMISQVVKLQVRSFLCNIFLMKKGLFIKLDRSEF